MSELEINIQAEFKVDPSTLYTTWLSDQGHENITGGEASIRAEVGSDFSAWDGYITGKILELEPGKRILQTWRTSEFSESDEDSIVEVILEKIEGGTKFTLIHTKLATASAVEKYHTGWQEHYVQPMAAFFNN